MIGSIQFAQSPIWLYASLPFAMRSKSSAIVDSHSESKGFGFIGQQASQKSFNAGSLVKIAQLKPSCVKRNTNISYPPRLISRVHVQ